MLRLFPRGKDAKSDKPDAKSDEPAVELSRDVDVQDQPAVLEAWTTHVLDRPELIRARAVNGATICAAVATALAAFGGLKGLSGRPVEVQFAVVAAVITWLGSVWLYSCAIVYSHSRKHPNEPAAKTVNQLVKRFDNYAGEMRTRVRRGHIATGVAFALTAVAVSGLGAERAAQQSRSVHVTLAAPAARAVVHQCDWSKRRARLEAKVRITDLQRRVIPLDIERCAGRTRRIWLPAASIVATRR